MQHTTPGMAPHEAQLPYGLLLLPDLRSKPAVLSLLPKALTPTEVTTVPSLRMKRVSAQSTYLADEPRALEM